MGGALTGWTGLRECLRCLMGGAIADYHAAPRRAATQSRDCISQDSKLGL
jgi:hypothetical protein